VVSPPPPLSSLTAPGGARRECRRGCGRRSGHRSGRRSGHGRRRRRRQVARGGARPAGGVPRRAAPGPPLPVPRRHARLDARASHMRARVELALPIHASNVCEALGSLCLLLVPGVAPGRNMLLCYTHARARAHTHTHTHTHTHAQSYTRRSVTCSQLQPGRLEGRVGVLAMCRGAVVRWWEASCESRQSTDGVN
jgi:hypothetical protein